MNIKISSNFQNLSIKLYIWPALLLISIAIYLFQNQALNPLKYIEIQKDWFYLLNAKLSQWPQVQYNLTQFGDVLIFFSFLSVFIIKAPKLWQALAASSIISAILSKILKEFFCVPRPAAILSHETFNIIGMPLTGPTSSLPSGHSITIFTTLTVLFFAFLPLNKILKTLMFIIYLILGLILASTRVGIGAHFPLDVIIGSIIGFISGITGIFLINRFKLFFWIGLKKYHPFFIFLLTICLFIMIKKTINEQLFIFFMTLISLLYSLFLIISDYVKK